MAEVRYEAKTVWVEYQCDKCRAGNMKHDSGVMLTSFPPRYEHRCTVCGETKVLYNRYPRMDYERGKQL